MTAHERQRREDVTFRWSVATGPPALASLAGVAMHDLFVSAEAIIEAYRVGRPKMRKMFGPAVSISPPSWAPTGYGHVNTLGADLIFPKHSEVAREPIHHTLGDGLEAMRRAQDIDFTKLGMFPFYLDLWEKLKRAFPDEDVPFGGFGVQGPITTAYLLRGDGFFYDVHDEPDLAREYLGLIVDSAARFALLLRQIHNVPDKGGGLVDDVAAMIAPPMWPDMVLPFEEQYFRALTTGPRRAHIEDLRVEHLPYLDELKLDSFDPSVSARLTPALLRDHCNVVFGWRLNAMQVRTLSAEQIAQWVPASVADGASRVHMHIEAVMCNEAGVAKVRAFMKAAEEVAAQ